MASTFKDDAVRLVQSMPDESTWDDLMRMIYERLLIEQSRADFREGRTHSNRAVRARFGLDVWRSPGPTPRFASWSCSTNGKADSRRHMRGERSIG